MTATRVRKAPADTVEGLWAAEQALAAKVIELAHLDEESFFAKIEEQLNGLCEAIARHMRCESVAVFFVDQATESFIRMRGAYGNLKAALDQPAHGGEYCIPTGPEERWRLTQRVWRLGDAYIANSRRDLEFLAKRSRGQRGPTDEVAYRPDTNGWAMRNVFRSLLCIPIFARGATRDLPDTLNKPGREAHREFLHRYHVVGLIKLEGKLPSKQPAQKWQDLLERPPYKPFRNKITRRITRWLDETGCELSDLIGGKADLGTNGSKPPKRILAANQALLSESPGKNTPEPFGELVDFLTECLNAQFTWDDAEVVVAIAMQLGRILALRVMQYADECGMLLDENAIGSLDIRHSDVVPLQIMMKAARRVCRKMEHELRILGHRIEDADRRDWEALRPGEPYEHRPPVRDITSRAKELSSLLAKVLAKEAAEEKRAQKQEIQLDGTHALTLSGIPPLGERTVELQGQTSVLVETSADGGDSPNLVSISGKLRRGEVTIDLRDLTPRPENPDFPSTPKPTGKGAPTSAQDGQSSAGKQTVAESSQLMTRDGFVKRIRDEYCIEDLAGVRVVCPYLSDVNRLVETMQAHFRGPGIRFDRARVDCFFDHPRKGGHRATHLVVFVDPTELIKPEEVKILRAACGVADDEPLEFPCEIQLMTAYQHSWTQASHELVYKRSPEIPRHLREHLRILSALLYDSDQIADLVQAEISRVFEGEDYGRRELVEYVDRNLSIAGATLVKFGLHCAQVLYHGKFRYGGRPHLAHAIAVARILIGEFKVDEPELILAALLHDMWMDRARRARQDPWRKILKQECEAVIEEFGNRLELEPKGSVTDQTVAIPANWLDDFMAFLSPAWKQEDVVHYRIEALTNDKAKPNLNTPLIKRALVLECAIVLSRFPELRLHPNVDEALRRFEENYQNVERLLNALEKVASAPQDLPLTRRIARSCERIVRDATRELGITMPIEWGH